MEVFPKRLKNDIIQVEGLEEIESEKISSS